MPKLGVLARPGKCHNTSSCVHHSSSWSSCCKPEGSFCHDGVDRRGIFLSLLEPLFAGLISFSARRLVWASPTFCGMRASRYGLHRLFPIVFKKSLLDNALVAGNNALFRVYAVRTHMWSMLQKMTTGHLQVANLVLYDINYLVCYINPTLCLVVEFYDLGFLFSWVLTDLVMYIVDSKTTTLFFLALYDTSAVVSVVLNPKIEEYSSLFLCSTNSRGTSTRLARTVPTRLTFSWVALLPLVLNLNYYICDDCLVLKYVLLFAI